MKNKFITLMLCAGLAAGVLTGCGGSKDNASAPADNSGSSNEAEAPAETEAPADTAADAGDYPKGPVTVIIPYSPGGGSDILTRKIMEYIKLPNDQNLVAVNVDGASGFTGCMQAFNSKNDGYTILAHNHMDVVSYTLNGNVDIPLYSELTNICGIVDDFNVLVTNKDSGWTTLEEAVEYVHAHPGEVKVGNTGSINANMADCLRALDALGIRDEVTVVPYDGGAENKTACMGNHVQLSVNSCADIQTALQSGDHIPLMVIGDRRAKALPDTPCTKELGYDVVTTKPRGWFAPKGMDPAQVAVLQEAIKEVCAMPEFEEDVLALGLEVNYVPGDEMLEKVSGWVEELTPIFEEMKAGQ